MNDFFDTGTSDTHTPIKLIDTFKSIYGFEPKLSSDLFLGINLQWIDQDLDLKYHRYFLSWHTEQLDIFWLQKQSQRVYPRPITVVYDSAVDKVLLPDNVTVIQYNTWYLQLLQLVNKFGINTYPSVPKHLVSSLTHRTSQYKNFVTGYLLEHAQQSKIVLSYHAKTLKPEDLHSAPNVEWLCDLKIPKNEIFLNILKESFQNTPVSNGNWHHPAYTDSLVNCTNESFHYSLSAQNGISFCFPGPYLTEKTWKPLLAGRPFLSVSQSNVYNSLEKLGFDLNFGFAREFDNDQGDITRIKNIFKTLDYILDQPIIQLFEASLDSTIHNIKHITNGNMLERTNSINLPGLHQIQLTCK
jgi:hypothetical protein